MTESTFHDDDLRRMARARVRFRYNVATYVIVNAMLVAVWSLTRSGARADVDADAPWGFWPAWVIVFWGVGLAFQAWHAYGASPDAVSREEAKLRERYAR